LPTKCQGKHRQKHVGSRCGSSDFSACSVPRMRKRHRLPAAGTQFDGTYAFVSSTKVNETYMQTKTARIGQCGNGIVGPLSIVNGQARYSGPNRDFEGTVGPQGELVMRRHEEPVNGGETPGRGATTNGKIHSNGTARARQVGGWRSHDLTWQREPNPAKPEPNRVR